MVVTFQNRLGKFQDKLRSKLINNSIKLSGQAFDVIRIKTKRTKQGDIDSRTIVSNDVVSILFPVLIDIPMRRIDYSVDNSITIDSFSIQDVFPFELYCPEDSNIERDDLIIRVIFDTNSDKHYVMTLQVKDYAGTISANSLVWRKIIATYYDESLPPKILEIIHDMVQRRDELKW